MRNPLLLCSGCQRHVKIGSSSCPFCQCNLAATHFRAVEAPLPDTRGWKRAALFSFGAALSSVSCSSTTTASDAAAQDMASPQDRAPPQDVARDVSVISDAPEDFGGIAPPYGIAVDSGPPEDDGGVNADYGAPPRDSGVRE
jgi:hypothetical protein